MYKLGIAIGTILEGKMHYFAHDDEDEATVFSTRKEAEDFIKLNVIENKWIESNMYLFFKTYCQRCAKLHYIPLDEVHPDDFGFHVNVMYHFKCTNPNCRQ